MRDKWYGDNRDLIKWGVLLELSRRHGAKHILQVLYFRKTDWGELEVDGELVELPTEVLRHFRTATSISSITCPAQVETIAEIFRDRGNYLQLVLDRIRSRVQSPGIVFLDPDTGLEPRVAGLQHVLEEELAKIWILLRPRDLIVFYQHQTNRNGAAWIQPKKEQFERVLSITAGTAKLARAPKIAPDVAFFYAEK
jgi:hypothetical protein